MLPVILEGLSAQPNLPIVSVAPTFPVGVYEAAARGGRGGPVEHIGAQRLRQLGEMCIRDRSRAASRKANSAADAGSTPIATSGARPETRLSIRALTCPCLLYTS